MRFGIHVALEGTHDNAIDELVARAREAHERGLDLWTPQLMDVDALTAMAIVGHAVPGLQVGTAVVPTYPRHPLMLAGQALTAQAATGGRFVLGIGLSHRIVVESMFGMSYDKPIRHLREHLELLMPALRGEQVATTGETISGMTFTTGTFAGASAPPVLVAAMGDQMLDLAGRLTDGTALWMTGPRTVADHIVPTITRAAAGRSAPRVLLSLPLCVTADPDAAREVAGQEYAHYGHLPSYRAMLDREGVAGPGDVAIVGDEESVAAQLHHLGEIGVTDLALPLFGSAEERSRSLGLLGDLARGAT